MNLAAAGPAFFLLWLVLAALPLVIALWLVVQIVGIRRALDRIARTLEARPYQG
jgi:hypothetical protein